MNRPLIALSIYLSLALVAGCNDTAINRDRHTTFLSADDMVAMTNKMAKEIVADPRINQATAQGPLIIVIKPVENLTNEVIPPERALYFVARLQGLLASQPELRDRFVWVMNKADYDRLRAEEFPGLGESEARVLPQYALWAQFSSHDNITRKDAGSSYYCQYKLNRISGQDAGTLLWSGDYEVHKFIKKDILD